MLKLMTLENFKCFGEEATVPLAPLTLIYGQNSAGKSSIIQALQVLKYCAGKSEFKFPLNQIVTFRDFVHRHALQNVMCIGISSSEKKDVTRLSWKDGLLIDPVSSVNKEIVRYLKINFEDGLGPFRGDPARQSSQRVSDSVTALADFNTFVTKMSEKPELIDTLNQDMGNIGIPYRFTLDSVSGGQNLAYFVPTSADGPSVESLRFNASMVGFGISQLVPVLGICRYHSKKIISIQQPELHIHPAMQTELGTFFSDVIKKQENQLLVETHSEHLLLRVQRLIRRGELKPEQVSVIYVEPGASGAKVRRIELRPTGALSEWPQGFLADRADEIYGA